MIFAEKKVKFEIFLEILYQRLDTYLSYHYYIKIGCFGIKPAAKVLTVKLKSYRSSCAAFPKIATLQIFKIDKPQLVKVERAPQGGIGILFQRHIRELSRSTQRTKKV